MPEDMPEDMPEHMPEDMPDRMPEDMSDRMPEDLPVRKCINVMVGITRSKVIVVFSTTYSCEKKILLRNITRVSKCQRKSYCVTSRVCASAREDLTA